MSILPNKYVSIEYSSVGLAALIIELLQPNDTVSTLWDRVSGDERIRTFDRFADALTLLYAANVIDLIHGSVRRLRQNGASS